MKADAWKSTSNEHVYGVIAVSGDSRLTCEHVVGDKGGNVDRSSVYHGIAIAKVLEEACKGVEDFIGEVVPAICTDEAGQYRRAKDILALRYPQKFWGKCYAHWVNGLTKRLFFTLMKDDVTLLGNIVDCFRQSDPWANRLFAKMMEYYGKAMALYRALKERWTTVQYSFASVLRARGALQSVATDHHHLRGAPECIKTLFTNGAEIWERFERAEGLARPLTQAALWMQRNDVNLGDVLYMIARLWRTLNDASASLGEEVEGRWFLEEQPLLLIAGLLEPRYASDMRARIRASATLTVEHVAYFAVIYHKKFIGDDVTGLADATLQWVRGPLPQQQLCGNSQSLWELLRMGSDCGMRKLAALALFVLSLPVSTADCERLFSDFGYIQTKSRNRLGIEKVHWFSQVKQDVRQRDFESGEKKQQKRRRILSPVDLTRVTPDAGPPSGTAVPQLPIVEAADDEVELITAQLPGPATRREGGSSSQSNQQVGLGGAAYEQAAETAQREQQLADGEAMYAILAEMVDDEEDYEAVEEERRRDLQNCSSQQLAEEAVAMKHSTGEDARAAHHFPAGDADKKSFPQQPRRLRGARGWKLRLSDLFRHHDDVPLVPDFPPLLRPFMA
eukprot:GHVU01086793.1.p1 GENE.GHVU01086793.1~~GHVU01086793.1.p1  ORF type:complete len:654 (+),score=106.15 GHVU01086793.1:106-1962(+)